MTTVAPKGWDWVTVMDWDWRCSMGSQKPTRWG